MFFAVIERLRSVDRLALNLQCEGGPESYALLAHSEVQEPNFIRFGTSSGFLRSFVPHCHVLR
jgi:hypothetical protein